MLKIIGGYIQISVNILGLNFEIFLLNLFGRNIIRASFFLLRNRPPYLVKATDIGVDGLVESAHFLIGKAI